MRWTTRPLLWKCEWHLWFAWHPILLDGGSHEPGRWLWLEKVWRRKQYSYAGGWYDYVEVAHVGPSGPD
jgi:hypothetical protein